MNQTINISLPKAMMEDIRDMIAAGHFASVSEAIRSGVNKVKLELHPRYYRTVKLNAKAEKRFEKSMDDLRAGRVVKVKSFADLLK